MTKMTKGQRRRLRREQQKQQTEKICSPIADDLQSDKLIPMLPSQTVEGDDMALTNAQRQQRYCERQKEEQRQALQRVLPVTAEAALRANPVAVANVTMLPDNVTMLDATSEVLRPTGSSHGPAEGIWHRVGEFSVGLALIGV